MSPRERPTPFPPHRSRHPTNPSPPQSTVPTTTGTPTTAVPSPDFFKTMSHLKNHSYTNAAKSLSQSALLPITPSTTLLLQRLFPQSPPASFPQLSPQPPPPQCTTTQFLLVLKQLAKFPKAPGFSRLNSQHLYQLCQQSPTALNALTLLANSCLSNSLPSHPIFDLLRLGRGVAFAKKVGARPIGINEVFLKAVGQIALQSISYFEVFHPHDFGVGKSGGMDAMIHSLQALHDHALHQNLDFFLLKTDFTNAFNTVSRQLVLDAVASKCPTLLPFVIFRYTNLQLIFRDINGLISISATTGVIQGDALSSFLFQLASSFLLDRIRPKFEQHKLAILSYLDDNLLPHNSLQPLYNAFLDIKHLFASHGLILNNKTKLICSRPLTPQELLDFPLFSPQFVTHSLEGEEVLGGFIGTTQQRRTFTSSKFQQNSNRIHLYQQLIEFALSKDYLITDSTPSRHLLLNFVRYCAISLPIHSLRVIHPVISISANECLIKSIASIGTSLLRSRWPCHDLELLLNFINTQPLEISPPPEPPSATDPPTLCSLPTPDSKAPINFRLLFQRRGGLGLLHPSLIAPCAYAGSISLSAHLIQQILSSTCLANFSSNYIEALLGLEHTMQLLPSTSPEYPIFNPSLYPRKQVQRTLAKVVLQHFQADNYKLISNFSTSQHNTDDRLLHRHTSNLDPWAGSVSHADIRHDFNPLTDVQFLDFLHLQLLLDPALPHICSWCSQPISNGKAISHGYGRCATAGRASAGKYTKEGFKLALNVMDLQPTSNETFCNDHITCIQHTQPVNSKGQPVDKRFDGSFFLHGEQFSYDSKFSSRYLQTPKATPLQLAELLNKDCRKEYSKFFNLPNTFITAAFEANGAVGKPVKDLFIQQLKILQQRTPGCTIPLLQYAKVHLSKGICKANTAQFNIIRWGKKKSPPVTNSNTSNAPPTDLDDDQVDVSNLPEFPSVITTTNFASTNLPMQPISITPNSSQFPMPNNLTSSSDPFLDLSQLFSSLDVSTDSNYIN